MQDLTGCTPLLIVSQGLLPCYKTDCHKPQRWQAPFIKQRPAKRPKQRSLGLRIKMYYLLITCLTFPYAALFILRTATAAVSAALVHFTEVVSKGSRKYAQVTLVAERSMSLRKIVYNAIADTGEENIPHG